MYDLQQVEYAIELASQRPELDETQQVLWLRRRFPFEVVSLAVQQLRLLERAQSKFSRASQMWFTPEGLAQSSAEPLARYHASRFPPEELVVDAGCGIGGDLIALAERGQAVGVERNALSIWFARRNLRVYEVAHRACLVHADLLRLRPEQARWLFIDPSRRVEGERTADPSRWQPDWETACALAGSVRGALIKAPPSLPSQYLPIEAEYEYLSVGGECREVLVAFGECRRGIKRSALLLPEQERLFHTEAPSPAVSEPQEWIYDPDPAVVAAHLIPELAQQLQASLLHPRIAYLTAPRLWHTPFARAYHLIEYFPFTRKRLLERLRSLGAGTLTIKKRGVVILPEELLRMWRPVGDRPLTVFVYRAEREVYALIAEAVS